MSDPLGLIGRSGGGAGVSGIGPNGSGYPPAPTKPADPNQPSFKELLMDNIRQVNELQSEATNAIEDFQTGKRADLEGVLLATQKADTAFRMLLAVRNKVHQAYEEVKQLRV